MRVSEITVNYLQYYRYLKIRVAPKVARQLATRALIVYMKDYAHATKISEASAKLAR